MPTSVHLLASTDPLPFSPSSWTGHTGAAEVVMGVGHRGDLDSLREEWGQFGGGRRIDQRQQCAPNPTPLS